MRCFWLFWVFLAVPWRCWLLLDDPGRAWLLLGVSVCSCELLAARSWTFLGAPGRFKLLLGALRCPWQLLALLATAGYSGFSWACVGAAFLAITVRSSTLLCSWALVAGRCWLLLGALGCSWLLLAAPERPSESLRMFTAALLLV